MKIIILSALVACTPLHAAELPAMSPEQKANVITSAPQVYQSCKVSDNSIALTFDDGPVGNTTVLEVLKKYQAKATFFVIGKCIAGHEDILRQEIEAGCEVGNHSWTHPHLQKLDMDQTRQEIAQTSEAITKACGKAPALFRPPFFYVNTAVTGMLLKEFGLSIIFCDVNSFDYRDQDSAKAVANIMEKTVPGSIILCHENQPTTVAALPEILEKLTAKGFKFVTVSELIAKSQR